MLHLIDGNNQFRIKFEAQGSGQGIRGIIADMQMLPVGDQVIWVWDGHNAKARRRALYPLYKEGRNAPSDDFYRMMDLFKQVLLHTRCISLEVPTYEADDVIAQIVKGYAGKPLEIEIQSNDGDYEQLVSDTVRTTRPTKYDVPFDEVRLMKALTGDTSDKITGIPFFGTAAFASCDKARWLEWFKNPHLEIDFEDEAARLGLKQKRHREWMACPERRQLLRNMWEIVGFFEVPEDLIRKHIVVGKPDSVQINTILQQYLL